MAVRTSRAMSDASDRIGISDLAVSDHTAQHDRGDEMAWWASVGIPDPHARAKALYATRPAELRPLPAPARPKKASASKRKPRGERKPDANAGVAPHR